MIIHQACVEAQRYIFATNNFMMPGGYVLNYLSCYSASMATDARTLYALRTIYGDIFPLKVFVEKQG